MKFHDHDLNSMLEICVKPAAAKAGFSLFTLNEDQPAGLIDNQIRAATRGSRFVIADLSHDNIGAYFEAGFGEELGRPVIYTCEQTKFSDKKTHFDTNHMVTVMWSSDEPEIAGKLLTATILSTIPEDAKFD